MVPKSTTLWSLPLTSFSKRVKKSKSNNLKSRKEESWGLLERNINKPWSILKKSLSLNKFKMRRSKSKFLPQEIKRSFF
jgi:hypothetical protein